MIKGLEHSIGNNRGSVIIIGMVVLLAVSTMGVTMINLGNSEQDMGYNEQVNEQSFFSADSCLWVTGKFLHHLYTYRDDQGRSDGIPPGDALAPGIVYPASVTALGFFQKMVRDDPLPYFTDDGTGDMKFVFEEDLGFVDNLLPALADIRPRPEEAVAGANSNQQNAGYSAGIGLGGASSGGYSEIYVISCEGRPMNDNNPQAASRAYARYRKVAGITGGL